MPGRIILYNIFIAALAIVTLPWVVYQLVFVKKRRRGLAQRFGSLPAFGKRTIWCHAVSVGEVRAISPMLTELQNVEGTRDRMVLSTVTLTGQETANRECGFVNRIIYFPLDLPFVVSRAVRRINPEIFITAETEIWPNFFNACFKRGIPVVVVNGRISDTSFTKYLRFRWFFRPVLRQVSFFLMQSDEDARRILELGAVPETVKVTGNMKYDRVPEPVSLPETVLNWVKGKFLLVAGSTHAGEEEIVLEALKGLRYNGVHLALVPRHPERFDDVAELLRERGVPFTRYSEVLNCEVVEGSVVLVDAMGILEGFYALADVAFVGGSLVPVGGHNLLEPAAHGVPVLTGQHMHNFRDITHTLVQAKGCRIVLDKNALAEAIFELYRNEGFRKKMGYFARTVSREASGATMRNAELILERLLGTPV